MLRIAFGVLMLGAILQWRKRPDPAAEPTTPELLARLDGFGLAQAFLAGLLLSGLNPQNLLLTAAGAAAIDAALTATAPMITSLLVFTGIASLTVALPVIAYFVARERADALFGTWKEWLIRNNATIMLALLTVFGTLLISRGLHVLAAP
jgi:hypothetical protein